MSRATKPIRLPVAGRPPRARIPALIILAYAAGPALLFWRWRPVGLAVWSRPGPGAGALRAACAAGWALAVGSTFLISHPGLFSLRQAWLHARRVRYRPGRSPSAACAGVSGIR